MRRASDVFGNLRSVSESTGSWPVGQPNPTWGSEYRTRYTYDVAGRLLTVQDHASNQTTLTYDLLGRKMSMNDPDMGAWSYTYDTAGNLVTQTDARNVTIGFGYDGLNRLTQKWQSGSSSGTVLADYSYDAFDGATQFGKGRRTGMRAYVGGDVNNSASWTYDKRGRVTAETHTIDGEAYTVGYTYDSADRVRRLIYPTQSAETVNLAYTTQGLPARMYSSVDYVRSGNAVYDVAGRLTQLKLGKQSNNNNPVVQMAFTYHPWTASGGLGRLQKVKAGTTANASSLQDLTYGYDTAGNVRWIVDARNSGQRQCFSYDGLDRLLRGFTGDAICAGYDDGTGNGVYDESYSYNNAGNLVSKTGLGTYSYGVAQASSCPEGALVKKHAVVSTSNGSSYCYDQNGNMRRRTIGGNTYTLTYDDENRLISISGAATASFTYDADGNRVKSVMNGEMVTTIGNLYEKKVVGGATTHTKYYYFSGQRVAVRVAGVLYWLLGDHLGSTTVTANGASGVREAELWYKPWGENRGTPYQTTPTTYRFTGQREDASIGLYFYNARYYDSSLGRFIQGDSIVPGAGNPQNLNRYSYVGNNPLRFVDPSGNAACAAGDTACWQEEWRWNDRWYKAHGHTGGDWFGNPGDPEFEDEQILRETVGEAGVSITGAWDFATQLIPMATRIVRFGNKLSGGLAQLRGLLGGGAKIKSGSCFGHPCALPAGTDTVRISNAVHDATWLMHTVVHELAHIIDWHSHIQTGVGPYGNPMYGRFSDDWNEKPLTNYAAQSHFYPARWDVWAEAVTVWVFGNVDATGGFVPTYGANDIKYLNISSGALSVQMSHIQALLEGW